MVPRAYAIIGIAAGALGTAMVAATVSSGSLLGRSHPGRADQSSGGPVKHRPTVGSGADPGMPTWFTVTMTVLLACYVLAIAVLIAMHRRGRDEDDDTSRPSTEEPELTDPWQTVLTVDLGNAAEEALARLGEGTPRNAIVACWLGLQRATRGAGLAELRTETPVEFTLRAVDGLDLDPAPITELSRLYREARFSEHDMGEAQRRHAGLALRTLADQLAARSAGPAPATLVRAAAGPEDDR